MTCDQPHFNAQLILLLHPFRSAEKYIRKNFKTRLKWKFINVFEIYWEGSFIAIFIWMLPFPFILYFKRNNSKNKKSWWQIVQLVQKYLMINIIFKALISLEISLWTKYFRFHNLTWLVWIETTQPQTCREVTTMTGFQEVSIKFLSSLNIEFPTRHPKTDCSFVRCLHSELCSNIDPRTEMSIYPDKDNKSSKLR